MSKRERYLWAAALVLLVGVGAARADVSSTTLTRYTDNALSAVALNASAGTRTLTATLMNGGIHASFAKLRVSVFYTYSAATTVTAVFSCSIDGTNYGSLTSRSIAAGASTVSIVTDTYTTSGASANIMLEYDVQGCQKAQVLFGGASAGAGDLITVDWAEVVGQ